MLQSLKKTKDNNLQNLFTNLPKKVETRQFSAKDNEPKGLHMDIDPRQDPQLLKNPREMVINTEVREDVLAKGDKEMTNENLKMKEELSNLLNKLTQQEVKMNVSFLKFKKGYG
jgi:hypothetical protein